MKDSTLKPNMIDNLVRPHLKNMQTYASVDPPEVLAKRSGIPKNRIIKLNGNENPFGGSPKASEALAKMPLHIYPDPLQRNVRQALSRYVEIGSDSIVAGAGSDELIDLLFRLFVSPGDNVVDCDPTFGMYSFTARVSGANVISAPRNNNFDLDVKAVRNAINLDTKLIFVSSPNNPTGNIASRKHVRELLQTGLIVVVDEAYYEFSNQTVLGLIHEYENLVVLRTLSKWAGLAGLRIGYAIMNPRLVDYIIDIKSPYNINAAAETALLASFDDLEGLLSKVQVVVKERNRMASMLKLFPDTKIWPSFGNFILCEFTHGDVKNIYEGLASRGIFVRLFSHNRLKNCFRVTVGTCQQTDALISAMKETL